jgi:hypothetical protein
MLYEILRSAFITGPFAWGFRLLVIGLVTVAYFKLKARVAAEPSRYVTRGDRW